MLHGCGNNHVCRPSEPETEANMTIEHDEEQTSIAKLRRSIDIATRASIAIVAIRCPPTEVFRVVETVNLAARDADSDFRLWTQITGWAAWQRETIPGLTDMTDMEFNPIKPDVKHTATVSYLTAMNAMPEVRDDDPKHTKNPDFPDDCFYVMLDAHHAFEESGFKALLRRQAQRAYECEQRLFIIMPETAEIPDDVAPFLHIIDYEYPNEHELIGVLEPLLDNLAEEMQPDLTEDQRRMIAQNGLGMHKTSFENAIALSLTDWFADHDVDEDGTPPSFDHICKWIRNYKMEVLRKTEVLELQEPLDADRIGGLQLFKDWMNVRKRTYEPSAVERGITPSRGILVCGPGGTGKSLIAKAAGSQLGLPVVRFDIGRVFGSFIGQSEGRMRMVLKLLDAMAPCVLMVDEIDKGFAGTAGGGGNDGGTSMRVFGTFLTWMQERKQKERPIFLVFTANRVQGLPPELMRQGRLDERWAVNSPNEDERREILTIHAKIRGLTINKSDMDTLVAQTQNLVGAEIESLIEQCLIHSYLDESDVLNPKHFAAERKLLKPLSESFKDDFDRIEEWGKKHARPASADPASFTKATHSGSSNGPSKVRRPNLKSPVKRRLQ